MNTILISYDLVGPESASDYTKVTSYIKEANLWAKPLESLWFIKTNKSTSEIRDDLKQITDGNDEILVLNVTGDGWATSNISSKVTEWMKNNL
jgi:hypothetical protein